MSSRVSRIQRVTATTVMTTPMPTITQLMTTPVMARVMPERRDDGEVGGPGEVDGLAGCGCVVAVVVDLVRHQYTSPTNHASPNITSAIAPAIRPVRMFV